MLYYTMSHVDKPYTITESGIYNMGTIFEATIIYYFNQSYVNLDFKQIFHWATFIMLKFIKLRINKYLYLLYINMNSFCWRIYFSPKNAFN